MNLTHYALEINKQSRSGGARKEISAAHYADEISFPTGAQERRDGTLNKGGKQNEKKI